MRQSILNCLREPRRFGQVVVLLGADIDKRTSKQLVTGFKASVVLHKSHMSAILHTALTTADINPRTVQTWTSRPQAQGSKQGPKAIEMSIFEVGGWVVKAAPVRETAQRLSKKRRRLYDHDKIESAGINVGLPQITTSTSSQNVGQYKEARKKKPKQMCSRKVTKYKEGASCARGDESSVPAENRDREYLLKQPQNQHQGDLRPLPSKNSKQKTPSDAPFTSLQKGMKNSLDGARFRLVC